MSRDPDCPTQARAAAYRADARRSHARAFADTCLGLFWLACMVMVAVLIWKVWGLVP